MKSGLLCWTADWMLGITFVPLASTEVKDLCNNVRKPGEMLPAAGDGAPQPNRGTAVSVVIELRLKQAANMATYFHLTQRDWNHQQATLARIEELWEYRTCLLYTSDAADE